MLRYTVASLVMVVLIGAVSAELPLLTEKVRQERAAGIIEGVVTEVKTKDVDRGKGYVDTQYAITIQVQQIDKGDGLKAGETIQVTAWQAKRRPSDWVGASGQGSIPKKGDAVRAYYEKGGALLLPNGIDIKAAKGK